MSAVIAAKVIISEYCGRNAVILLSYPVNRKTMLGIKCLIVSGIIISPGNIVWVMLAMGVVFVIIANFVYHVLANGIEKMEV